MGVRAPVGAHETCRQMGRRGQKVLVAKIPGVGYAPMFLDEAQVAVVKEFLLAG